MSSAERKYEAKWTGKSYCITTGAPVGGWWSDDGDVWRDLGGHLVTDPTFNDTSVVLIGGPRDGETVA